MNKLSISIFAFSLLLSCQAPIARAQTAVLQPRGFDYAIRNFTITYNDQKISVDAQTLQSWQGASTWTARSTLNWQQQDLSAAAAGFFGLTVAAPGSAATATYHYRLDKIYAYVSGLAKSFDQPTVEPSLVIQNNRVADFNPGQTGVSADAFQTALSIAAALENSATSTNLIAYQTKPQTRLAQTNTLGINELVAEGVSSFKGSPNNRRHNIAVGIEKFKGLLIAPGQEFSFDDNLGPVTAEAGFLPELVIDKGNTLPELGGGLCQVSTTVFRAAMAGGLPITDRRNHAYAVSYYNPQGTDATIYPGSADLKFVNNTPGYLMVWPYEKDPNTLVFDFYGTSDGRQVTLEKPVVYDRKADGSMKAQWTRIITAADGTASTSTFRSTYQPPALFHKTEEYVSATGTPSFGLKIPAKTQ